MVHGRRSSNDDCPGERPAPDAPEGADQPSQAGRGPAEEEAFVDEHLDRVYAAACLILGERGEAASATVAAFARAWHAPAPVSCGTGRRHLMRGLYLHCTRRSSPATADGPQDGPGGTHPPLLAGLRELSLQQRSVIAMRVHGELDRHHIAEVVSLPVPEVSELMRTGLRTDS